MCKLADLEQIRLLDRLDEYADECGLVAELGEPYRPEPTALPAPRLGVDLTDIGAIVWATGIRPQYPWLDPSLLDSRGQLVHDGGVANIQGMYVLGLPFLRRRKSSFLDGAGPDAVELTTHLLGRLDVAADVS